MTSLNARSVALIGSEGHVPATLTPVEGGLVLFVLPKEELLPQSDYTLVIQGAEDQLGQPLESRWRKSVVYHENVLRKSKVRNVP